MRESALLALLLAAGLVARTMEPHPLAQVVDSSACEQSCYERKSICVSACGRHTDPVECEAQCHDELLDCLKQCR